ncbi:hypothetical protein D8674_013701 [Pyrus ussuriensis x Pyrus communis]|uniref:Uncharacterized protein n=1 Tax=Pyrus ussuriensis x Pyrus communis TaxID=2448454 RepID=A0A5N5GVX1_9ROSA|nr:hypothetical protein D8674_013701 [Pyrus ussuriensis x Pyrus communis]
MNNSIYELIMLSKTTVIAKPKLLTTTLLFCNSGTNTFDFRMGHMSSTNIDMAQVFGLRPSGRVIDVTHDRSSSSCPTVESSGTSDLMTRLEYNSSTFKSYETSFTGFIPFVKKNFGLSSSNANRDQEHIRQLGFKQAIPIPFFYSVHCGTSYPHDRLFGQLSIKSYPKLDEFENWKKMMDVGLDEAAVDELVGDDISKLFGDSEAEAEVEIRAPRQARPKDQPETRPILPVPRATSTKKRTRAQASKASKVPSTSITSTASLAKAGRKKQKSSRPQGTKKPTFVLMDEPLGAEMYQKDNPLLDATIKKLEDIRGEGSIQLEPSSPYARSIHASPSRVKPSKAKIGEIASSIGQGSILMSFIHPSALVVTLTSQFNLSTGEMLHFMEDNSNSPIVPEIHVVSVVTSPRASLQVATTTDEFPPSIQDHSQFYGEGSGIIPLSSVSKNYPSQQLIFHLIPRLQVYQLPSLAFFSSIADYFSNLFSLCLQQTNQDQAVVSSSLKFSPNLQGLDEEGLYCFLQSQCPS